MSEAIKDCVIKLFGKTIAFPSEETVFDKTVNEQQLSSPTTSIYSKENKDVFEREITETKPDDDSINPLEETMTDSSDDSKIAEEKTDLISSPNSPEDEPSESSFSQEKEIKKPEKIRPCPRCNSKETKFCYFNNHNANQPRHFCKNCQRYWTAGGMMRNVPVGSGRRKNKNVSSRNYTHLMVLDEFKATEGDSTNGFQLSPLKSNGFLIFGSDGPIGSAESMNHDSWELSNRSSAAASSLTRKEQNGDCLQEMALQMPPPGPCFPQTNWPPFGSVPVTFYPPPTYWGCSVPGPWNGTCVSPSSSSGPSDVCVSPSSSNLGKHFREGRAMDGSSNLEKENPSEQTSSDKPPTLIPKTLRIDDPNEAAKSSIWSAIGKKNKKNGSINGTSLFKAFESKGDRNSNLTNSMMVMRANPAALSRSLKFRESAS